MKKKLALLLVAAMTVTAIPATSFAGTTNRVAKVVTVKEDAEIDTKITFEDKGDITDKEQITVTLTNAEWDEDAMKALSSEGATDAVAAAKKALDEAKAAKDTAADAKEAAEILKGDADQKLTAAKAETTTKDGEITDPLDAYNAAQDPDVTKDELIAEGADLDKLIAECDEKAALVDAIEAYNAAVAAEAKAQDKVDSAAEKLTNAGKALTDAEAAVDEAQKAYDKVIAGGVADSSFKFELVTAKEAIITYTVDVDNIEEGKRDLTLPIKAIAKDSGDVQLTIDPMTSNISGGTYTVGIVSDGGSKTTIEKSTDIGPDATKIKPIVITETTPGSLKVGQNIKLKLGGNFEYDKLDQITVNCPSGDGEVKIATDSKGNKLIDEDTIELEVTKASKTKATKVVIDGIYLTEDDAEVGNEAEITVSGAGTSKATLTVAKYVDYGYSWKAEDEEVPVLYSGRDNGDTDLLKVTFKELAPNTINANRTATITLPEGVKFKTDNSDKPVVSVDPDKCTITDAVFDNKDRSIVKFTITPNNTTSKSEVEFEFDVEVAPDFTGDVVAKFGGTAVGNEEAEAVVATVVAPVKVEAKRTDVSIDYRNVEVADITITEAYPGALEKGKTLTLEAEKMEFESGWDWEVTEGDIKIDDITKSKGKLSIEVKSESSKTPSTITISGLKVYLDRTLPVGDYKLKLVANDADKKFNDGDAFFQTHDADATDKKAGFDCDSVTVVNDYIRVVTAGRDQDDSTFTTKITVTVGESTLTAGDKVVQLDVPAFINADSRAMLPVRAVIEALSGTVAIKWDDATKTAFFSMGSRVFSMTVGQKTMSINGTNVAMTTAPVIVNERIFIPLRDLGVALGLNDDKIHWDDATKTATLNGTVEANATEEKTAE